MEIVSEVFKAQLFKDFAQLHARSTLFSIMPHERNKHLRIKYYNISSIQVMGVPTNLHTISKYGTVSQLSNCVRTKYY